MSRISVVLATYNGALFLKNQLDSILQQSLKPYEIIVSDDHSTDETVKILREYEERGEIKWVFNKNEKGVIGNFKSAASFVSPDNYIAFSDQDDIWLPNKLRDSFNGLTGIEISGHPAMVYSDPEIINSDGDLIASSLWDILGYNNYNHALPTILFGNPAGGLTMLINPELAKVIRHIPQKAYMHDAWLTLYAYTFGVASIVEGHLVQYRQHENNVTFSTGYKRTSRYSRIFAEIKKAIIGESSLFVEQFSFVRQFYQFYKADIPLQKIKLFENFLSLENQGYIARKLAFRKAMKATRKNTGII